MVFCSSRIYELNYPNSTLLTWTEVNTEFLKTESYLICRYWPGSRVVLCEGGVVSGATCRSRLIGKKEMSPETIQVAPIATGTDFRVIHSVYCKGSLICTYLKTRVENPDSLNFITLKVFCWCYWLGLEGRNKFQNVNSQFVSNRWFLLSLLQNVLA